MVVTNGRFAAVVVVVVVVVVFFFLGGGGLSKRAITRGFLARRGAGPPLYRLIQVCAHATPKGMVFAPFRSEKMFDFGPYIFV